MNKLNMIKGNVAAIVACLAAMMVAPGAWAQNTAIDEAASKVISSKMNKAAETLASIDGAKVETINDDNGLPAILVTLDAGIVSSGTNEISEAGKTQLQKLATVLTANKAVAVEVLGHSDNSKWRNTTAQQSVQRNLALSETRARSVANDLKSRGVPDSQIKRIEGKGESEPKADNSTVTGRAANRRVEVFLLASEGMIADAIAESRPAPKEPEAVAETPKPSDSYQYPPRKPKKAAGQVFEKGDFLLFARSSGLDLGITSVSGYSATDFGLNVGAAYFVLNKLALTGELQLNFSKVTNMDAATTFGFGLGARYYLLKALYAGLAVAGAKVSGVEDFQGLFAFELGYDIFLNEHVFIEPALQVSKGVNLSSFEIADPITFGLSFGIGVKF